MALREGLPATIYRKDYTAPEFAVTTVDLLVQITPGRTEVMATLEIVRQGSGQSRSQVGWGAAVPAVD
jgi:aminopeptidase N